jgi:hypothetical protein
MVEKINSATNKTYKELFYCITLLWLMKVFKEDDLVDGENHGIIEEIMMEMSEKLAPEALKILECVGADDQVIGSPFADPKGKGFEKYIEIL